MAKTLVILQSNYVPWKGYFDLLNSADEFVIYDEVQFTRRDWRNRNRIVARGELTWLTLPVESKGRYEAPICEIRISDKRWASKHWSTIQHAYAQAPFFADCRDMLRDAYDRVAGVDQLSAVNRHLLEALCERLEITTPLVNSDIVPRTAVTPTDRLIEICKALNATTYLSGPAAKSYIDSADFKAAGIELRYANYSGYPTYDQDCHPFEHGVSIIDLLMAVGPDARDYLKTSSDRSAMFETPVP